MEKISVILPVYNREQFIERAVQSILQQSHACQELLIIDDGSIDGTAVLVSHLQAHSKIPVRYFSQPNQGPASARNLGIQQATGDLVAFLDSDDHWTRHKLQKQVRLMQQNPDYLISHTFERWLRRGKHLNQKKKHIPGHDDIFGHCLQLCAVGMSTVIARKELFEKVGLFNPDLPCCEDYDMWLRVSANHNFLLVEEPLTVKEGGREDQVSWQYRIGMDRFRIRALQNLLKSTMLSPEQRGRTVQELEKKCTVYGNGCMKHGKEQEGRLYLDLAKVIL